MGEHQTNVPSNSFPLSSTSAAHGYPLYVIIDKSIEQNIENYSVFFWQSMYWALFHHMTLLCMAMHTTCEPEHGQDVTADLLDYLQPQASKMHSSACNFTANAEPERQSMHQTISIYEALGESQLAPRTSRAHDTHGSIEKPQLTVSIVTPRLRKQRLNTSFPTVAKQLYHSIGMQKPAECLMFSSTSC